MKIAYIAGPYRAETPHRTLQNISSAESAAIALWRLGYAVICPHKNSSWFDGSCEDSVFLKGYLEILRHCNLMVLFGNWYSSNGTLIEREIALEIDIPIFIYPNELEKIGEFAVI